MQVFIGCQKTGLYDFDFVVDFAVYFFNSCTDNNTCPKPDTAEDAGFIKHKDCLLEAAGT